jgi:hypothetical protein
MSDEQKPSNRPSSEGRTPVGSKVSYRLTQAKLQAAINQSRRRYTWVAMLVFLVIGAGIYNYIAYKYNRNYNHYRAVAADRFDINIQHRELAPSDLSLDFIRMAESQRLRQPVSVVLSTEKETLLLFYDQKGKLFQKRRVTDKDLNLYNISVKYQSEMGETGNRISLVYSSKGIAKLVVTHVEE